MNTKHTPIDGVTRCECGCKYWEQDRCADCGDRAIVTPEVAAMTANVIAAWEQSHTGTPQNRRSARRSEAAWLDRLAAVVGGYDTATSLVAARFERTR